MKKRILISCIIVAMLAPLACPAAADTISVTLPGLTLSLPKGMTVLTQGNHVIPRVGIGGLTQTLVDKLFDPRAGLQLYAFPKSHDYQLSLYLYKNGAGVSFSQTDESGMLELASSYNEELLQSQASVEEKVLVIKHPQTNFLYFATAKTRESGSTMHSLTCETREGDIYLVMMLSKSDPLSEAENAGFQDIMKSMVFSTELNEAGATPSPGPGTQSGEASGADFKSVSYEEGGFEITMRIPQDMEEVQMSPEETSEDRRYTGDHMTMLFGMEDQWAKVSLGDRWVMGMDRANFDVSGQKIVDTGWGADVVKKGFPLFDLKETRDIQGYNYLVLYYETPKGEGLSDLAGNLIGDEPFHILIFMIVVNGILYDFQFLSIEDPAQWEDTAIRVMESVVYP